jgi:hypothetical protein
MSRRGACLKCAKTNLVQKGGQILIYLFLTGGTPLPCDCHCDDLNGFKTVSHWIPPPNSHTVFALPWYHLLVCFCNCLLPFEKCSAAHLVCVSIAHTFTWLHIEPEQTAYVRADLSSGTLPVRRWPLVDSGMRDQAVADRNRVVCRGGRLLVLEPP